MAITSLFNDLLSEVLTQNDMSETVLVSAYVNLVFSDARTSVNIVDKWKKTHDVKACILINHKYFWTFLYQYIKTDFTNFF